MPYLDGPQLAHVLTELLLVSICAHKAFWYKNEAFGWFMGTKAPLTQKSKIAQETHPIKKEKEMVDK